MRVLGILTKTSKPDLFILEGNSSRYLIKENLPSNLVSKPLIVYGTLNLKVDQATNRIIQFLNPKLILDIKGQELWRASKASSSQNPNEEFSPDDDGFF